jgi:hypothetical protein
MELALRNLAAAWHRVELELASFRVVDSAEPDRGRFNDIEMHWFPFRCPRAGGLLRIRKRLQRTLTRRAGRLGRSGSSPDRTGR